jgi:hypothetical protein
MAKQTTSKLFATFMGNKITIVVKSIKGTGSGSGLTNLMLVGTMLDECSEYIYLGQDQDDAIYAAVKKDEVATLIMGDYSEDLAVMEQEGAPDGKDTH